MRLFPTPDVLLFLLASSFICLSAAPVTVHSPEVALSDLAPDWSTSDCSPREWHHPYRSEWEAHQRDEQLETLLVRPTYDDTEYTLSAEFDITHCPTTRYYYFDLHQDDVAPDGFNRSMHLLNRRVNAPLIEANEGDTIVVWVNNLLSVGTTLHWHGLVQNGTAWADGPHGVTQCAIPPGSSFYYEYTLNSSRQYGTYFYHAHRMAQYADGLLGPLIVHSVSDSLKRGEHYDIDQVLVVRDHYHVMSQEIVNEMRLTGMFRGSLAAPSPNSGLINGRGRYDCRFAAPGERCTSNAPLPVLTVPENARVRLRIINPSAHAFFRVSVDNHPLDVIEADDTAVWGPTVHRVPINIGQRYSVVFDTSEDTAGDTFWLRAVMNTNCFGSNFTDLNPELRAVVRVVAAEDPELLRQIHARYSALDEIIFAPEPDKYFCWPLNLQLSPTTDDWSDAVNGSCIDLNDSQLVPRQAEDAPLQAQFHGFNTTFMSTPSNVPGFGVNNVSFELFANDPLLFRVQRGASIQGRLSSVIWLNDTQNAHDIVINNVNPVAHPMHLHGADFFVLAIGNGSVTAQNISSVPKQLTNPLRRDTLSVPPNGFAIIRLRADDPGVWAMHCHITFHQSMGLMAVVVVRPDLVRQALIPAHARELCSSWTPRPGNDTPLIEPGRRRS